MVLFLRPEGMTVKSITALVWHPHVTTLRKAAARVRDDLATKVYSAFPCTGRTGRVRHSHGGTCFLWEVPHGA